MRFIPASLLLMSALTLGADTPNRFIKVDITEGASHRHHREGKESTGKGTEIHMRMPLSLAKGILESCADKEIHINGTVNEDGQSKKVDRTQTFKTDELMKFLESAKPGDLLLEVNTDEGDHIKVAIE